MKLLLKQKMFSWFDSYNIYGEDGNIEYKVHGELSLGHKLKIVSPQGEELGEVKEKIISLRPTFDLYEKGKKIGSIKKKRFNLFGSAYNIESLGWIAQGNFTDWSYSIHDSNRNLVATIDKQLLNLTDTYVMDIVSPQHALHVLMFVIAIDAEKCSKSKND
ncbi:LURP-one-related/scramblase family protein [uncultured Methanobrevibacter sp.]|uniref:LURP-one-related/scramblase family protein n=1 Tax=uncultured Methanobrevibacter sp. TaxID=253161 RepID=UPI0025F0FA0B|nr:LURP-one-related family protein [uncultured Methanobrevibacter sp.]